MHFDFVLGFIFYLIFSGNCENDILSVVENDFEKHLLFATVSGHLYLFNKYSGEQIWKTKLDQFIKTHNRNGSMLIPNPISGQLYIFQHNSNNLDLFTQLEHSLYEYVRQTPVFLENMLLTGSKNDNWLSIDMSTGKILNKYRSGSVENCPQYSDNGDENGRETLHVGICEYSLVVSDKSSRHVLYKVVLNSMSTHAASEQSGTSPTRVYGSSDSGLVVALSAADGRAERRWSGLLDSAVIGAYEVTRQNVLASLNLRTMSHETVRHLILAAQNDEHHREAFFRKSMFFGHTADNDWYVLKSYIGEETTPKAVTRSTLPLITAGGHSWNTSYEEALLTGFYELPKENLPHNHHDNLPRTVVDPRYLIDFDRNFRNSALIPNRPISRAIDVDRLSKLPTQESLLSSILGLSLLTATFLMTLLILYRLSHQPKKRKLMQESFDKKYDNLIHRRGLDENSIVVGDISYNPKDVLGYGTNGTTVFRGVFHGNNRSVAVKRLIQSDQSHYELQFLRQSFDCSNLIKCFYITESREFTFLALELCDCTLEGYVTDHQFRISCGLDNIIAIKQMMTGVLFLHEKGIVHRDLKPRNVLLMQEHKVTIRPETSKDVEPRKHKIVISDFGLSRQSLDHCQSITKTGCGGTSGYMAPELSKEEVTRITTSADIFSCAILFYYIYTYGQHPFGADILARQHRIHQGQYLLNESLIGNQLLLHFIRRMLQSNPVDRPSAEEILHGPIFWKSADKLSFISDISDFVEKADVTVQLSLDSRGCEVFSERWTDDMEAELVANLQSQRGYKTRQLSHLIRALRNKKNHFHELPESIAQGLFSGSLEGLSDYVEQRFPHLLSTLYDWVRGNIEVLGVSVHRYYPSSLCILRGTATSPDDRGDCRDPEDDVEGDGDYLEWRRPSRKRPTQAKKHRGSKNKTATLSS